MNPSHPAAAARLVALLLALVVVAGPAGSAAAAAEAAADAADPAPVDAAPAADDAAAEPAAAPSPPPAPVTGKRDVRRLLKEAEAALAARRAADAASRYERLLADGSVTPDGQRADALWGLALAHLVLDAEAGDAGRAEAALGELLASHPGHPRRLEAAAIHPWLAEVRRSREAVAALAAQGSAAMEQGAEDASRAAAMGTEAAALRRELNAVRKELAEAKTEIEKKDRALERVKATLVDR